VIARRNFTTECTENTEGEIFGGFLARTDAPAGATGSPSGGAEKLPSCPFRKPAQPWADYAPGNAPLFGADLSLTDDL